MGAKDFARISPNLPDKFSGRLLCDCFLPHRSLKTFFGMTSKKRLYVILPTLGAIFARIFKEFAQIFKDFARIFIDFARFLINQNFWGCACTTASFLHHCYRLFKTFSRL